MIGAVNSKGRASKQVSKVNEALINLGLGDKYVLTIGEPTKVNGKTTRVWTIECLVDVEEE